MTTENATPTEPANLCAGEFTPATMVPASETWALVYHPDRPRYAPIYPVVAWASGTAELQSPTGNLAETLTTALVDVGTGNGAWAAELRASGYEVITGTRDRVEEEREDLWRADQ
ncbi:hypothetical protein ACWDTI_08705 [Gordonia sp. NPDC003424]